MDISNNAFDKTQVVKGPVIVEAAVVDPVKAAAIDAKESARKAEEAVSIMNEVLKNEEKVTEKLRSVREASKATNTNASRTQDFSEKVEIVRV